MENIQDFKIREPNGNLKEYDKGAVVRKNGKEYVASKTIRGYSPEHGEKAGWKEYTDNRIKKYTESTSAPLDPLVGDEWYDTSNGILFKYIDDETSTQWVEI